MMRTSSRAVLDKTISSKKSFTTTGGFYGLLGCLFLFMQCKSGWPSIRENQEPKVQLKTAWTTSIGSKISYVSDYLFQTFAGVAIGENKVFVGSTKGTLYALNEMTGQTLWKQTLSGPIGSTPVYLPAGTAGAGGIVLVGNEVGDVTSLDAGTGKIQWTHHTKAPVRSSPVYHRDHLFFISSDGVLHKLRAKDGEEVWVHERASLNALNIRTSMGLIIEDDIIYAGFLDGHVVALKESDGEVLWKQPLVNEQHEFYQVYTPVLRNGTLYVSTFEAGIFALQPQDGSIKWHYDLKRYARSGAGPLAVDDEGKLVYVSLGIGGIYCLDASTGIVVWRQSIKDGGETSAPVIKDSYLLVASSEKGLYVVDRKQGSLNQYLRITNVEGPLGRGLVPWNGITEAPVIKELSLNSTSSPSGKTNRIFFITNHEKVYAVDMFKK